MGGVRSVRSSEFGVSNYKCRHNIVCVISCIICVVLLCTAGFAEDVLVKVKKPVFAGSFYPGERSVLAGTIDGYLKETGSQKDRISGHVFGIVAPHAGYQYSGRVAAYAYNQVKGKPYTTVILMGPTHRVPFNGAAIYPSGSWETPLGMVQVDHDITKKLAGKCAFIKNYPIAFEREHSIEVQIPFLQQALKDFKIVPVVMGMMEENDYKILSDALCELLQQHAGKILIVASSDMSHFHNYREANQMDKLTLKEIQELNTGRLAEGLAKRDHELCGSQAVLTLMMVAKKINGEAKVLYYANSGDVIDDKNRVVGYGAVAFSLRETGAGLSKREQKALLACARKTLEETVTQGRITPAETKDKALLEKRGVFVTLTKNGKLRGCIGYIMPIMPLYRAVSDMTVSAASRDPRFPPVAKEELQDIHIEISVLSPLKNIDDPREIEIGKHGLFIVRGNNQGLLLPQVATEYMWSREEFLKQTCLKAGLPSNAWREKGTKIYSFSAQIFSE
jgi:AmmeMemoRadiSam system protein B/AmmeMemoRadiSam system protein A